MSVHTGGWSVHSNNMRSSMYTTRVDDVHKRVCGTRRRHVGLPFWFRDRRLKTVNRVESCKTFDMCRRQAMHMLLARDKKKEITIA